MMTTTTKTFKEIAQEFLDALNQVLEEQPYDDSVTDTLNDIFELLDATVNDL